MLVLPRKIGQSIMIDERIKISILGISKGIVRVGVDAPKNVTVDREEIYQMKVKERQKEEKQ